MGDYSLMIYMDNEIRSQLESNGFISIYVFGKEGHGKTSYALWLGWKLYRDWDMVLKRLYLEPRPLLAAMFHALEHKRRLLYVIADDPGRWLNKLDWSRDDVRAFTRFYNIIRTAVVSIVFTSPADDIVKDIRKKSHVRSKVFAIYKYINKDKKPTPVKRVLSQLEYLKNFYGIDATNDKYSVVQHSSMEINIMFKEYPILTGLEVYPTHYPDYVHEKYMEMRRKASLEDIKNILRYHHHGIKELLRYFDEEELASLALYVMNRFYGVSIRKLEQLVPYSRSAIHKRIKWVEAKLYEYISNLKGEEAAKAAVIPEDGDGS